MKSVGTTSWSHDHGSIPRSFKKEFRRVAHGVAIALGAIRAIAINPQILTLDADEATTISNT